MAEKNLNPLTPAKRITIMNASRVDARMEGRSMSWDQKPAGGTAPLNEGHAILTVWFDGGCPLCMREIAVFRKLDRRGAIHFEDISLSNISCPVDRAQLLARFHAQEQGKTIVSGAAAFAALWRAVPVLRPFGELARIPLLLWALEHLYTGFLRLRPRLQRLFA